MKKMRALSIRQPMAEQVLQGIKKFEYRSRSTILRERIYIYASMTPGDPKAWKEMNLQQGDLPTGLLVGTVEIVGCTGKPGDYEWHLANPERLSRMLKPSKHPQPAWFYPF